MKQWLSKMALRFNLLPSMELIIMQRCSVVLCTRGPIKVTVVDYTNSTIEGTYTRQEHVFGNGSNAMIEYEKAPRESDDEAPLNE